MANRRRALLAIGVSTVLVLSQWAQVGSARAVAIRLVRGGTIESPTVVVGGRAWVEETEWVWPNEWRVHAGWTDGPKSGRGAVYVLRLGLSGWDLVESGPTWVAAAFPHAWGLGPHGSALAAAFPGAGR